MPNCPCEAEAQTCVTTTAPVTGTLSGDCINVGLATADTSTVDLNVNGSGQLTGTVVVSGDAGQALETRASGLFVPSPSQTTAASLLCDADDCGEITPAPSSLPNAANGLEVRTCPGTCGGANQKGLWAPPELHRRNFFGQDTGNSKFAPFAASNTIPSGTGVNSGNVTVDNGWVFRQIPHSVSGNPALGATYQVDNPFSTAATLQVFLGGSAGKFTFANSTDNWVIDVISRIYMQSSAGATSTFHGGARRVTAAMQTDDDQGVAFTVGGVVSQAVKINPGDWWRIRGELIYFIRANHASAVTLSGFTGLKNELTLAGSLTTNHAVANFNIGSI